MNDLQIEYFLAVAKNLSFTKTAEEKYVSQPAVSKQISAMEDELGVRLFERTGKTTRLTDAGKLFEEFYRKHRKDLVDITEKARQAESSFPRMLKIACVDGWALTQFMPGLLGELSKECPDMKAHIESYGFSELAAAVNQGEADIGVTLENHLPCISTLSSRHIASTRRILVYSDKSRYADMECVTPLSFRGEEFFVPRLDEVTNAVDIVKGFCEPYGFLPKVRETNSITSIIVNVRNGLGVAILDDWVEQARGNGLRHIGLDSFHEVYAFWKRNNRSEALRAVLKLLGEPLENGETA